MASQPIPRLTEEEYLRIERAAAYKSEYVGGEVFAMAGGSPKHSLLQINCGADLRDQLRGKGCRVFSPDMRMRAPITGDQLYPDVSVVCGPVRLHPGSNDILTNPTVVVEVLSPSTAKYDRGARFGIYQQFDTLRDYLIIHQDAIRVEHHSRQLDGTWATNEYEGPEARVTIASIGCELHLASIYEGVMDEPF